MQRYKIAAVIVIIHGLIELGGFFSVLPIWIFGMEQAEFIPFEPPAADVVITGVVLGVLRIIGGVALYKNLRWGLAFSALLCTKALFTMLTILPFGVMDGILAGTALILMLTQYFGKKKISE